MHTRQALHGPMRMFSPDGSGIGTTANLSPDVGGDGQHQDQRDVSEDLCATSETGQQSGYEGAGSNIDGTTSDAADQRPVGGGVDNESEQYEGQGSLDF